MSVPDPLRENEAGAARGLDADRVETGRDVEIAQLRRFAEIIAVIGREALGSIEEERNARFFEQRHARYRVIQDRLEMIHIGRQRLESMVIGDAVRAPRLCLGLEGADEELACILIVVGAL